MLLTKLNMINIFSLSKNDFYIRTLMPLLKQHAINITGTCINPDKALSKFLLCEPRPDIVLLDAYWNNHACWTCSKLMALFTGHSFPPPKFILVTNCRDTIIIKKLAQLGAQGYFYRTHDDLQDIVNCIKKVYASTDKQITIQPADETSVTK